MSIIAIEHLTKTYRIGVGRARVREMLPPPVDRVVQGLFPGWWAKDSLLALDDVSLSISAGSSVGVIGHNGAGKTTLLKLIARVTAPTQGRVVTSGRIAALIDLLIASHPDLNGRENVLLLGAMYGVGRRQIRERLDRILEFAEIEPELLESPAKRLSLGMSGRLGFAVVTALDVDILLVDEVLAVGDASFQKKCATWLDYYRRNGGTLLFVSHNLGLVRSMTERVIWLEKGRVAGDGPATEVVPEYVRAFERRDLSVEPQWSGRGKAIRTRGLDRWGAGGAWVEAVHFEQGNSSLGQELEVSITYEASGLERAMFCFGFIDETGTELGAATSQVLQLANREGSVVCKIRPLALRSGVYFPVVGIVSEDGRVRDRWKLDRAIVVEGNGQSVGSDYFGPVKFPSLWSGDVVDSNAPPGRAGST